MDALTSLRVFREVVEAGSFVKAAERLDISTAMTSKHVANLERQLGVRLLNRTTRHLSLTEAGSVYYEQCSEALDILQAAEAAVGVQTAQPQGVLKVTAPGWFANRKFADMLVAYQARYPERAGRSAAGEPLRRSGRGRLRHGAARDVGAVAVADRAAAVQDAVRAGGLARLSGTARQSAPSGRCRASSHRPADVHQHRIRRR